MSGSHFNNIINEDPVFSKYMYRNIKKFPKNTIQYGNSCSLWFFASIVVLLESEKDINLPPNYKLLLSIIDKMYELWKLKSDFGEIKNTQKENVNLCSSNKTFVSYQLAFSSFIIDINLQIVTK